MERYCNYLPPKIAVPNLIRTFCLVFGLLPIIACGQEYSLHKDLAGYKDCGQLDNPLSCLENTLKSIDADQGYYSQFSENRIKQFKAEYCMQLAYTYRQVGKSNLVRKNLELAAGYLKGMDLSTLNEDFKSFLGVKNILVDLVRDEFGKDLENREGNREEFQRINELMKDYTDIDEVTVSANRESNNEVNSDQHVDEELNLDATVQIERTPQELKEIEYENRLLQYLRSYLNKNPLSEEFIKTHATDSCVIQIQRLVNGNSSSLVTYVSHTNHLEQIGMHLMDISKEIKYNNDLPDFDVKMTILVRPSNYSSVSMKHGIFYVYYAI